MCANKPACLLLRAIISRSPSRKRSGHEEHADAVADEKGARPRRDPVRQVGAAPRTENEK
jgi:hypothetical protein